MEYARKLRDDRGKCNIEVVDDGDESPENMGEDAFEVRLRIIAAFKRFFYLSVSKNDLRKTVVYLNQKHC
jgi:hypothetical protein